MAFTITCDNCGSAQKFTSNSSMNEDNISFGIYMSGGYQPTVDDMTIYCENPKCNKYTSINC